MEQGDLEELGIVDDTTTKKCSKCWTIKDLREFRFRKDQNRHRTTCISCDKILSDLLSKRILSAIKNQYGIKAVTTIKLLGCDIETIRKYLESKFQDGMSWENHGKGSGKWNIDHIIPCAAFDLTKEEEQRKCFHYSNLQPLWEIDNLIKSDKLPNGEKARDI